jgi:ABC-2 type transport system ATP-binding protein
VEPNKPMSESALSIKDLKKTYGTKVEALKGISLEVRKGDFFALLGPNGAGKSTTINIVVGLANKTSGVVKVFGKDITNEAEEAKMCIGIVPQEFNFGIFEKVEDIVINQAGYYGIPRKIARGRAEKYLKQLGLWEKKDHQARTLSGGLKRRLMIARALMHEPRLLILDEPTAGVDIELRRGMYDFLRELNKQGITIILTTHYFEEAEQLCRNVAIIDKGAILVNTPMKQLLKTLDKETYIFDIKSGKIPQSTKEFSIKTIDDHSFEVEIAKKENMNTLFDYFNENGVEIVSMRTKANRLEEMFLSLIKGGKQ